MTQGARDHHQRDSRPKPPGAGGVAEVVRAERRQAGPLAAEGQDLPGPAVREPFLAGAEEGGGAVPLPQAAELGLELAPHPGAEGYRPRPGLAGEVEQPLLLGGEVAAQQLRDPGPGPQREQQEELGPWVRGRRDSLQGLLQGDRLVGMVRGHRLHPKPLGEPRADQPGALQKAQELAQEEGAVVAGTGRQPAEAGPVGEEGGEVEVQVLFDPLSSAKRMKKSSTPRYSRLLLCRPVLAAKSTTSPRTVRRSGAEIATSSESGRSPAVGPCWAEAAPSRRPGGRTGRRPPGVKEASRRRDPAARKVGWGPGPRSRGPPGRGIPGPAGISGGRDRRRSRGEGPRPRSGGLRGAKVVQITPTRPTLSPDAALRRTHASGLVPLPRPAPRAGGGELLAAPLQG